MTPGDDGFTLVARDADITEDAGVRIEVGGRAIALFRAGGRVCAIDDECPHRGASLSDGYIAGRCVTCPWHAWEFDLETGAAIDEPDAGVAVHEVRVENGGVLVRLCAGACAARSQESGAEGLTPEARPDTVPIMKES